MGYNEIFGGSTVYPSNQTYDALDLTSDISLAWPIEAVSSETIMADILDVTPSNPGGWNITLPDATGGSSGITMVVSNLSSVFSFNFLDASAAQILTLLPGTVWLLYLTDNSTAAGVWRCFQYGAQAGSINAAAIAGSGLVAIGSSLNQSMPVVGKSTNYTAVISDRAIVILWTGAAGTLTLPSALTAGNNWFINVRNIGTGDLVVSPPSGTIDGAASKTFSLGVGSASIFTDGTNYYTIGYGGASTVGGFDYTTLNCAGSDGVNSPITLSPSQQNRISYKLFGILTGNRSIIVPPSVQQYWINNQTTSSGGPWTMTIKTLSGSGQTISQPGQAIIYCDGLDMQQSQSGITLPVNIASGGTGAITAPTALTNLGATAVGTALFTTASATTARATLGSGATGDAIFQASTPSVALTAMSTGTMTGTMGVSGLLTAGGIRVTSSSSPIQGIYLPAANQLGFATNSTLAGYFDATQNLILTHALAVAQGGTGATNVAGAANNLGDPTVTANSLAQRNAGANILANFFNMNGAVDNLAISHVFYENASDGYIRHMTLANFRTKFDTGQFLAAASGYQVFASGITIQWGIKSNVITNNATTNLGGGFFAGVPVTLPLTFPAACWAAYGVQLDDHVAGSAQAADHFTVNSTSQISIHNNSNGTQSFYWFAIGN